MRATLITIDQDCERKTTERFVLDSEPCDDSQHVEGSKTKRPQVFSTSERKPYGIFMLVFLFVVSKGSLFGFLLTRHIKRPVQRSEVQNTREYFFLR